MVSMKYCPMCGGSGVDIDGNVCSCRVNVKSFYDMVSCLTVPEQYRGIQFNSVMVPRDVHESYARKLQNIYDEVATGKWLNHNVVIASPINHSKTILAYSCMELLFRQGSTVFPLMDLLEIKRVLLDMDYGRAQLHDVENPEYIYTTPILFTKIPKIFDYSVVDIFATLLDRRVRRGLSTIFLYDGYWAYLTNCDNTGTLAGLMGEGNYNTVEIISYSATTQAVNEPQLKENIG